MTLLWSPEGPGLDMAWLSQELKTAIPSEAIKLLDDADRQAVERYGRFLFITMEPGANQCRIVIGYSRPPVPNFDPQPFEKYTHDLVATIRTAVDKHTRERLDAAQLEAERQRKQAAAALEDDLQEQNDVRAKLRAVTGRLEVSPEAMHAAMAKLDDERQSLTLDREDLKARLEAIAEAADKASMQAREAMKNDPVAVQLEKLVEARKAAFDQISQQHKVGVVTGVDMQTAAAALAEAQVRLAERREAVGGGATGQLMAGWNKELLTLSIELRQKSSRLSAVEAQSKILSETIPLLGQLDHLRESQPFLQKRLDRAEADLADLARQPRRPPMLIEN
jgi:DNA repair exonuclease SbcCD ATPase subunit